MAAISEEQGYVHHLVHPKSISSEQYIKFLEQLSSIFNEEPFAVFADNLQVHKSAEVTAAYEKYKVTPIFNMPYSPQYNGIESYFGLVKLHYKNMLLRDLLANRRLDVEKLIKQAIEKVDDKHAQACARNGREAIEKKFVELN